MKFVFFGTPNFAAIILEKLIKTCFIPQAVVCNPDRPVGRKKIITAPPTKLVMRNEKLEIRVIQPENFSSSLISHLSSLNADFFIVAAYSKIIPKEILEIPRLGTIGVHPSLLPKYRGPSPIQTAILNGDEKTGVTLYLVDEGLDSGKIVSSIKYQVSSADNYISLHNKLAELGTNLLIEFLQKLDQCLGSPTSQKLRNIKEVGLPEIGIKLLPQDESQATYTKKFKTEDGYIKPKDLEAAEKIGGEIAVQIERKIRALNPEPGVYTFINGKRTKILEAKLIKGKLKITQIQIEGKKPQRV